MLPSGAIEVICPGRYLASDETAWGSAADREAAEIALGSALYEMKAWTRLALSRPAVTLEDAAIQLGLTFAELFEIDACDLEQQLKSGDLERDLGRLLQAVGGIALCVARHAGVDRLRLARKAWSTASGRTFRHSNS